jgi:hypothetical protein
VTITEQRARARTLLATYHATPGLISYLRVAVEKFPDVGDDDSTLRAAWYAFEAMEEETEHAERAKEPEAP